MALAVLSHEWKATHGRSVAIRIMWRGHGPLKKEERLSEMHDANYSRYLHISEISAGSRWVFFPWQITPVSYMMVVWNG